MKKQVVQKARPKMLHNVIFHLHDMLENRKLRRLKKVVTCFVAWEENLTTNEHKWNFEIMELFYILNTQL